MIILPKHYNYIGAFLTFRCNMNCSYCINKYGALQNCKEMSGKDWKEAFSRIPSTPDLPITLQGGEPTLHEDFYDIVNTPSHLDLVTNGTFELSDFLEYTTAETFRSNAPYAGIRFSLHEATSPIALATKAWMLQLSYYSVGIWYLDHPAENMKHDPIVLKRACQTYNIDVRGKEFLGLWNGRMYGTYKYPEALCLDCGKNQEVFCKPSELLIAPDGQVYRCHRDLYAGENTIGHILDDGFTPFIMASPCSNYGQCNPCDIKEKFNRFQQTGHCSVEIEKKEV